VFAPVSGMPEAAQRAIAFNPIFYLIDGFRYGMTGEAAASLGTSIAVALAVNAVLFAWVHYWFRTGYRLKS
jgi:ABC-2 type transport system permease protein